MSLWDLSGTFLGPYWSLVGVLWEAHRGHLGPLWGPLEALWDPLAPLAPPLGSFWAVQFMIGTNFWYAVFFLARNRYNVCGSPLIQDEVSSTYEGGKAGIGKF